MTVKLRFLSFIILAILCTTISKVEAQGTPHPPTPANPSNGTTITDSNSVQLCANVSDSFTSELRFELYPSSESDFQTPWQSANPQGTPTCTTVNAPNGTYGWQVRGRNSAGEGGASDNWKFTVQVGSTPPATRVPGPQNPPAIPDVGPNFSVSFNPANGTNVGQTVDVHVEVQCNPNCGSATIVTSCGGGNHPEDTSGKFDDYWNTNGCNTGGQTVNVCTKAISDPQGTRANCKSLGYELTGSVVPNSPMITNFSVDNTVTTGQCTTLRWSTSNATSAVLNGQSVAVNGSMQVCPTVTTQYGLRASSGQGQDATGNVEVQVNGASVSTSSQGGSSGSGPRFGSPISGHVPSDAKQPNPSGGVDLITYCYAIGENNAGNSNNSANGWYCSGPQIWPVSWGQVCYDVYGSNYVAVNNDNSEYGWRCVTTTGSSGAISPQPNNNCGPSPSRLKPGDIAVVSDYDPSPLEVWNNPDTTSGQLPGVPAGQPLTIVFGPVCANGLTWVQIGYNGETGWAIEVNRLGNYNLIPNGMPLPGLNGSGNSGTTSANGSNAATIAHGSTTIPISGSYIHVPSDTYDLNLRQTADGQFMAKMSAGEYYAVLQTSGVWIQVQTSIGSGWVDSYYVELVTGNSPPVQPSQTLQPQANNGIFNCSGVSYNRLPSGIVFVSYIDKIGSGNKPHATGTAGECGDFVINKFLQMGIDIRMCVRNPSGVSGDNLTADWATYVVSNCGWTVDSEPVDGAIVTWEAGCSFGFNKLAGTEGHAAIVTSTPSEWSGRSNFAIPNTILVDESNWNGDHNEHLNGYAYPIEPCMHFIHVPGTPGSGIANARATASAVNIACILCNTNSDWVEVQFPADRYDVNTIALYFSGREVSWKQDAGRSSGGGIDTIHFELDAQTVNDAASMGASLQELQNPSFWYATYILTK